MNNVLEISNISKKYKNQHALANVSLTIKEGDIYGLIGRNGAGKTTLLKIITSLIQQTSGSIQLLGSTNENEYIKNLTRTGSVIETPVAYDQLTAQQNLAYYCKLRGIVNKKEIDDILHFVNLADTGKKKYKDFSLGMKQKMGIAIALLNKPDLLILDEPINGLDPIAIIEFRDLLLKLNQEQNITIIISSHILSELFHVANRFGILHDGHMLKELTKAEFNSICDDYLHLEVNDTQLASHLLKEQLDLDFKVVSATEINIFDYHNDPADIVSLLVKNDIRLSSIQKHGTDLESYFAQLIANQPLKK